MKRVLFKYSKRGSWLSIVGCMVLGILVLFGWINKCMTEAVLKSNYYANRPIRCYVWKDPR